MYKYAYLRTSPLRKIDYSYSPYEGDRFFKSYFLSRRKAIERISSFISSNAKKMYALMPVEEQFEFIFFDKIFADSNFAAQAEIIEDLPGNYTKLLADRYAMSAVGKKEFVTEGILKLILLSMIDSSAAKIDKKDEIVDQLGRKYEIFQRIASNYDNSHRKTSDNFDNMSNYVLLGIISADIFMKGRSFKYLNLALKVNDLIAQMDCVKIGLNSAVLSLASLEKETAIVKSMMG